ncbi:MAG: hypothetical protein U9Q90_11260 [Campylobacterota bacterium]|nr:hypothetical protein [Campylobacterota bacterium]
MKFTKLSLITAIAVSAAVAGGDIKPAPVAVEEVSPWTFGGDVKFYYTTTDDGTVDLFSQESATGQASAHLDVAYAITPSIAANFGLTAISSLGLEDHLVSSTWIFGYDEVSGTVHGMNEMWIDTLNITGKIFEDKTSFILGRTQLDTPLAFTETWSVAFNTFDAAVVTDNHIDHLTLVGGYIYDGNGNADYVDTMKGGFEGAYFPVTDLNGNLIEKGAWTVAAIGTFDFITAQAWYYDVIDAAAAVWLQADGTYEGFGYGAQYALIDGDDLGLPESSAFAVKLAYTYEAFSFWGAYSAVDEDGVIPVANTATMVGQLTPTYFNGLGNQSKLYTEAWWNYGFVSQAGAESFAVAAAYKVNDNINLTAQFTSVSDANILGGLADTTTDMDELTLLAETSFYGLDLALAYINASYSPRSNSGTNVDVDVDTDTVQAYLTYKF